MKCLILAAGYATRLYPLTENFPKPLLKVKDKTILDWLIDDLESSNMIDNYIIVSNHKYIDHFMKWKESNEISNKITIIDDGTTSNENRLGAVKDIELAINKLNIKDDLMVIAGDNLLDFSLNDFIHYFVDKKNSCIMRYFEENIEKIKKSAEVIIDKDDLVIEMNEKPNVPKSNWCCPPFYIYKKNDVYKVSEALLNGCKYDAPGSFIEYLCKESIVYAMEMKGDRYDIGTLESYNNICKKYKSINISNEERQ